MLVIRYFKVPPHYNSQLAKLSQSLFKLAVLMHFASSFITFSNSGIIYPKENPIVDKIKLLLIGLPFVDRITAVYDLIPFVMFFGAIFIYLVFAVLGLCFGGKIKTKNGRKNLLNQLSYESLISEYNETRTELSILPNKYPRLKNYLEEKLTDIGDILKEYLTIYKKNELLEIDSKELPMTELENLFYEDKEKLSKSSVNGLYSYKLLVSIC